VHNNLKEIVLDAEVIEDLMHAGDKKKTKLIEAEITKRLLRHGNIPKFIALGERLEQLRDKAEKGLINSMEFLKDLIQLAKDTVQAENEIDSSAQRTGAKTALTELFFELKTDQTPAIVERIVNDIDEIVKIVRFPGWQSTAAGEREVKQALRKTLYKYALHKDNALFDKAYEYIRQYY